MMSTYLPTVFGENLMDVFDDFDRNLLRGFGNVDHTLYGLSLIHICRYWLRHARRTGDGQPL